MRARTWLGSSFLVAGLGLAFAACSSNGTDLGTLDGSGEPGAGGSGAKGGASPAGGKGGAAGKGGALSVGGGGGSLGIAGSAGKGGASGGGAGSGGVGGKSGSGGTGGAHGGAAGAGGGTCAAPKQACGSTCTDVTTDPLHCGTCMNVCPTLAGAEATCVNGKCGSQCLPNHGDCDGNAANGCETGLSTDPAHCGSCTAPACPSGPNGAPSCAAGKCSLSCMGAFLDCNQMPGDGCEIDGNADPLHCGSCSMSCSGAACVSGACQCAGDAQTAVLLPLDMYIMMDQSGSMADVTSNGQTKWQDVKTALEGFFGAPASAGIGVGIQFFPAHPAGLPATCSNNSQCGNYGPCATVLGCSTPTPDNHVLLCKTTNDCNPANGGPGGTCNPLGTCQNNTNFVCPTIGQECIDASFNDYGPCIPFNQCSGAACFVGDYSTPAVGIAPLPGVAPQLTSALDAHSPSGGTPTDPALTGAVSYATSWESQHPGHVSIVVLATDGLPTDCTPQDIGSVAAVAAAGAAQNPPIRTFVIGVFTTADINAGAPGNLDTIAKAGGGTSTAFLVNTTQDVTMQFTAALNAIRATALGCSYQLPQPQPGMSLAFDKVNVQYTAGNGTKTVLPNVTDMSKCPATGGWYYDDNNAPTKVVLCPSSCTTISGDPMAKVEIILGCATMKP